MGKRIAVITATRAEYGLLSPLIRRIDEDDTLDLMLIVTGGHLSKKQGMTIREIEEDGFPIAYRIPILEAGNTSYDISLTMANATRGFATCFRDERPDIVVILGDRTEMLGIASAAMNERIPIAHICGGEVTEGAVDDCVRHAITKMSYLHFTEAETYRKRVIQLGEDPKRVYNVGSLGAENILSEDLLSEREIRSDLAIPDGLSYVVTTFHPITLEAESETIRQAEELCKAMETEGDHYYIITRANADAAGDAVNMVLQEYANKTQNARMVKSLGMRRYLSAVKYASLVLGNSSSGIMEAPVLGTPTVNIGDRQKGRLMADTIIGCKPNAPDICEAIRLASVMPRTKTKLFGDGSTSRQILEIMKDTLFHQDINLKKGFYNT